MTYRTVQSVVGAHKVNMAGHLINRPLSMSGIERYTDPFLLIDHINEPLKGGKRQRELGVGPHPHRGFSPVTLIFKGDVQHRDSLGNDAIVQAGGTQWMYAGRGVVHSERPSEELAKRGGENELIQLWINAPARHKMDQPYYLPLSAEDTPKVSLDRASISVVAGDYEGVTGPIKPHSPQTILRVEAEAGAELTIPLPQHFNALIYLLDGEIETDHQRAQGLEMVLFNHDAQELKITVHEEARFIVLSGEPLGENVVSDGPFVMNTQDEILEAFRDARSGRMGVLRERFH